MKWLSKPLAVIRLKGLTLTWDVLKYVDADGLVKHWLGLTLTWDVLKL